MVKYFVVACLCLMVALVQAQEETTTERRVERDVNTQDMSQMPGSPADAISNMAHTFTDGVKDAFNTMKDMIPGANSMPMGTSRRRRAAQQNQVPYPEKPLMDRS